MTINSNMRAQRQCLSAKKAHHPPQSLSFLHSSSRTFCWHVHELKPAIFPSTPKLLGVTDSELCCKNIMPFCCWAAEEVMASDHPFDWDKRWVSLRASVQGYEASMRPDTLTNPASPRLACTSSVAVAMTYIYTLWGISLGKTLNHCIKVRLLKPRRCCHHHLRLPLSSQQGC